MPRPQTLRRFSIALPLLGGALVLLANFLPDQATLLWGSGLFLFAVGVAAAVASSSQRRTAAQHRKSP